MYYTYEYQESTKATVKIIISLLRNSRKMSWENTHNECKFLGHDRPLRKICMNDEVFPWIFKSGKLGNDMFHNDFLPISVRKISGENSHCNEENTAKMIQKKWSNSNVIHCAWSGDMYPSTPY